MNDAERGYPQYTTAPGDTITLTSTPTIIGTEEQTCNPLVDTLLAIRNELRGLREAVESLTAVIKKASR